MPMIEFRRGENRKDVLLRRKSAAEPWVVADVYDTTHDSDLSTDAWQFVATADVGSFRAGTLEYTGDTELDSRWPTGTDVIVLELDVDCGGVSNPVTVRLIS
jgi:hypothetical protein